eukprot:TRINITY_DN1366_c0_g1_i2.p1 TRINITY_DN1366_c0_g1~~TRINITY_DN1366_c0_g1_i2.p1  ORF type:complete len:1089 (+),score=273.69 TRINITY_DN1366_c0_g1_i2:269-3535(+)
MKFEVERSAAVAWSPLSNSPSLLAAGTIAGTLSEDFDYSAHIEIFELNLQEDEEQLSSTGSRSLKTLGSGVVSERFNKLAWSSSTQSANYPKGLLAGGLANGSVSIWNPQSIINGEEALVTTAIGHSSGPVQGLEFNPFQPNLLASGGNDCEVNIWDLQDPTQPIVFGPGNKVGNQTDSPITCVAWNRKVQHILGTTNSNGTTVVWDLKAKRAVLSFHDPNKKIRCRAMAWNPDEATQLITASEDDATPIIEIWDLRNTHSPLRELSGHSRGIWAVSWCPVDSDLLLSTGKDNKTLCWNLKSGEVQSEVDHNSSSWNFDVQWSPRIPALLSTCSFEGKIKVVSLQDTRSEEARDVPTFGEQFQSKSTHAPKWLKRPAGVCFGFGGKLAFFKNRNGKRIVKIAQIVTDPELVKKAAQLQQAFSEDVANLQTFCKEQAEFVGPSDSQTWKILETYFHGDQRKKLIAHLGFNEDSVAKKASKYMKELNLHEEPKSTEEVEKDQMENDDEETSEFEKMISSDKKGTKKVMQQSETEDILKKIEIVTGEGEAGSITECIITGRIEEAVNICIETKRWAAAFLLAYYSEEVNLWERAQNAYLKQETEKFVSVIGPIVKKDYQQLIERSDLSQWKSVLAILCTYTKADEFALLASSLGDRLALQGNVEGATACFVCSGNLEKASEMWMKDQSTSLESTLNFVAKVIVLRKATNHSTPLNEGVYQRFSDYASFLASQGRKEEAIQCLSFLLTKSVQDPSSHSSSASLLLDRLSRSQTKPNAQLKESRSPKNTSQTSHPTSTYSAPPPFAPSSRNVSSSHPTPPTNTPFVPPPVSFGNSNTNTIPSQHPTTSATPAVKLPTPSSTVTYSASLGNTHSKTESPYSVNQPIGNAQYLNFQTSKPVVSSAPFIPPPIPSTTPSVPQSGVSSTLVTSTSVIPPKPSLGSTIPLKPNPIVAAPPPVHSFVQPTTLPHAPPISSFVPPPVGNPSSFSAPPTQQSAFVPPPQLSQPLPTAPTPAPKQEEKAKVIEPTTEENQNLIHALNSLFARYSQSPDPKIQKLEKDTSKRFEPFLEKLKRNEASSEVVLHTTQLSQGIISI